MCYGNIKVRNIDNDNLIRLCELNIGVCELAKDIDLNNMWGFTFEQLSEIEKESEKFSRRILPK